MAKKIKNKDDKSDLEIFQDRFIQEVDEDLKNENLVKFWNKYGLYVIIAVVLILTAAVSFETIKAWHEKKNQTWSDKYAEALNLQIQGKYEDSLLLLNDVIESDHSIYSDLSKVQVSNVYFEQGDTEKAIEALEKIVQDSKASAKLKDLAVIKIASYKLDTAPKDEVVKLLSPLASANNSWTNIAKEMLAMVEVRDGNIEEAKKIYNEILSSENTSEVLKFRVQDMLSVLSDF